MKLLTTRTALAVAMLTLCAAALFGTQSSNVFDRAFAEEAAPAIDAVKAPLGAPHIVNLAAELAALGRERKDALLVASAARLFADSRAKALLERPQESGGDTTQAPPLQQGERRSPSALLQEARAYAAGNQALTAVLDQITLQEPVPRPSKGTAEGHHEFSRWLRPGAIASYGADFRAHEPAEASIWGDGSGDLDLVVYDSRNNVVCVGGWPGDREWCRWFPRQNERFRIVVESRSPRWNYYSIFTN